MSASQCLYPIKDTSSAWIRVWLAAHDSAVEGVRPHPIETANLQVWRDWYTGVPVTHQPWDTGRPYAGGVAYNCMVVRVTVEPTANHIAASTDIVIIDEECSIDFCLVCRQDNYKTSKLSSTN